MVDDVPAADAAAEVSAKADQILALQEENRKLIDELSARVDAAADPDAARIAEIQDRLRGEMRRRAVRYAGGRGARPR